MATRMIAAAHSMLCLSFASVGPCVAAQPPSLVNAESAASVETTRPETPTRIHLGALRSQFGEMDRQGVAARFGLRTPVLPGTVCTFEDTGNWGGPNDLSDTGGFIFNIGTYPVVDNFTIDDNAGTLPTAIINTICTEGVYISGGLLNNGLSIPDAWEVSYWKLNGFGLPDVFEIEEPSPAAGIQPFLQIGGSGASVLTVHESENQNFGGGISSIFQLEHADIVFETETCYAVQLLNNAAVSGGAPLFAVTGSGAVMDGISLQDTDGSGDFSLSENTGGDIALALYNRNAWPTVGDWDFDFAALGPGGACVFGFGAGPVEPNNGFCDMATQLTLGLSQPFDMHVPSVDSVAFGRAGSYVENCPIDPPGVNADILGNFGLFYSITGDGTTFTASTCASQASQDTILMVYADSDPTDPCAVLYCVTGDNDGCRIPGGPAEVSWCTVSGVEYVIVVQSAAFTEGALIVTSDGTACDTLDDVAATTPSMIQSSRSGVPEGETCAQGEMGLGFNDGCGGANATSQEAETIASGDIRVGTSSNLQIPIADRGPDASGFGPDPAPDVQDPELRDQEYYNINIAEMGILTVGGQAEFPFEVQVFQYSEIDPFLSLTGCEELTNVLEGTFERGTFGSIRALITEPGLYAVSVSHTDESPYIYECGDGEVDYAVAVDFTSFTDVEIDESGIPIALQEPESCGVNDPSDSNAGCADAIPNAGPALADGETVYGEVSVGTDMGGTFRDIDQFSFTLASDAYVTLTIQAEMSWTANLFDNNAGVCGTVLATPHGSPGATSIGYALAAGNYSFLFTNSAFDLDFDCASGATEYAITLDVNALPSFTPSGTGMIEVEDYCAGVPYGAPTADSNAGCDATNPESVAGTLATGSSGQGTLATTTATDGSFIRDVDTWNISVVAGTEYVVWVASSIPLGFLIQDQTDCFNQAQIAPDYDTHLLLGGAVFVSDPADAASGGTAVNFTSVTTGFYSITVFPSLFGSADIDVVGCSSYEIGVLFTQQACPADITPTGVCEPGFPDRQIDLSDFSCYLSLWAVQDSFPDITSSGSCINDSGGDGVDLSDIACYLSLWARGCDGDPGTPF